MAVGPGGSHDATAFLASGSDAARCEELLLGGDDRVHGAAAGSVAFSSASSAVDALLSASFGWPAISVLTAPAPALAGAPAGADAAATASAARYDASLSPLSGSDSRSEPQPGRFRPSSAAGLVCSDGQCAPILLRQSALSCGRMASSTGEVTSERLSLMVWAPADASSRAAETELAGIHSAGRSPRSAGQLPMKPLTTWSGSAGLTPTLTHRSPTGAAVSLYRVGQRLDLIGDRRIGDDRDRDFAGDTAGGRDVAAVGQRVTEETPQDDGADHDDHGDEGGDNAEADPAPARGDRAVAAGPFAALPLTAVLRPGARWRWRRRSRGRTVRGTG